MAEEFGPVPVSRLKEEAGRVFEALNRNRKVLISRRGEVVAVIDPPDVRRHARELALFAVPEPAAELPELSATLIAQGSPSEFVHRAERGVRSCVTRNHKVYGFLRPVAEEDLPTAVRETEEALARLEREHPDVPPEQHEALAATAAGVLAPTARRTPEPTGADRTVAEALLTRGEALAQAGRTGEAEDAYRQVIDRYAGTPDDVVAGAVTRSMVKLGRLYVGQGRPADALTLVDTALARMDADPDAVALRSVQPAGVAAPQIPWQRPAPQSESQPVAHPRPAR